MERHKSDGLIDGKMADKHVDEAANGFDDPTEGHDEFIATAATVAVVGAGVIIFEAALLPGLVLGIATMAVPKYLPQIGGAINPLVRSTVRGAYKIGAENPRNGRRGAGAGSRHRRRGRRRGQQEGSPAEIATAFAHTRRVMVPLRRSLAH
jgi:hypothetical protein